jgi:hypothetical protein
MSERGNLRKHAAQRGASHWATISLLIWTTLLACGFGKADESPALTPAHAQLELAEQEAISVPASDQIIGAAILGNRDIAYWTPTTVRLRDRNGNWASVCLGALDTPRAAAPGDEAGSLEILDRSGLLKWSSRRGCHRSHWVGKGRSVSNGAKVERWVWVERDSTASRYNVIGARSDSLGFPGSQAPVREDITLIATHDGLVRMQSGPPHEWEMVRPHRLVSGRPPKESFDADFVRLDGTTQPTRRWIATGFVGVGSAFLQVIADVNSDTRKMLLYDSTGAFVRETQISYPFGVLGSDAGRARLLAIRRPDSLELVLYSWAWRAPLRQP